MTPRNDPGQYLTANTEDGMLIIHSSPITLSWIPRDRINDAYNVGGTVTAGTFECVDDAKNAAFEVYSVPLGDWQVSNILPFDIRHIRTEIHTPETDGHKILHHGIHWK